MMTAAAPAPAVAWAGRTSFLPRALRRIAEAAVAELAGVTAGEVSVELAGADGLLAVTVATALDRRTAAVTGTLVERAAVIGEGLARRLEDLAGRKAGRVHVRFTRLAGPNLERRVL